jgi:hypothetical protein
MLLMLIFSFELFVEISSPIKSLVNLGSINEYFLPIQSFLRGSVTKSKDSQYRLYPNYFWGYQENLKIFGGSSVQVLSKL